MRRLRTWNCEAAQRSAQCEGFDEAKAQLVRLTSHAKEQGGGVSVTRFWKKGAIEYKSIPGIAELDVERYRAAPREEVRITTA